MSRPKISQKPMKQNSNRFAKFIVTFTRLFELRILNVVRMGWTNLFNPVYQVSVWNRKIVDFSDSFELITHQSTNLRHLTQFEEISNHIWSTVSCWMPRRNFILQLRIFFVSSIVFWLFLCWFDHYLRNIVSK